MEYFLNLFLSLTISVGKHREPFAQTIEGHGTNSAGMALKQQPLYLTKMTDKISVNPTAIIAEDTLD